MSGLKSRRKGMRVEYLVRDQLRARGFIVDRVPASGAAQGFKGDLHIKCATGQPLKVEVKARKHGFKNIYKLLGSSLGLHGVHVVQDGNWAFSYDPVKIIYLETAWTYLNRSTPPINAAVLNALRGPSDILVIKADGFPPVYMTTVLDATAGGPIRRAGPGE